MKSVRELWNLVVDLIFPLDPKHARALKGLHTLPSLFSLKQSESGVLYGFLYTNELVRDCIVSLKNWGDRRIAKTFAEVLYDGLLELVAEEQELSDKQIVVTVIPISKTKKSKRGFNQCELVLFELKRLMTSSNIVFTHEALQTTRETEDQVGKSKTERKENLKGVFTANKQIVENSIIFVIDDVTTTGATLNEASRALKEASSSKIILVALAH